MSRLRPKSTTLLSNENFPFMFSLASNTDKKLSQSQNSQQESAIFPQQSFSIQSPHLLFESKLKNLHQVSQLHAPLTTSGLLFSPEVGHKLLYKYLHFSDLINARQLFDRMPNRNLVSWNVMIDGYVVFGDVLNCFNTFKELINCGFRPNHCTYRPIIKACKGSIRFHMGGLVHCLVIKDGFDCDCEVVGSLVDLYSESGMIEDANKLFDEMLTRETMSHSQISVTTEDSKKPSNEIPVRETVSDSQIPQKESAIILVAPRKPLPIDSQIIYSIMSKCMNLCQVKQAHASVTTSGILFNARIANRLLRKYINFGDLLDTRHLFERMPKRDLASCNLMIHGFARDGDCFGCFEIFRELIKCGVRPDHGTLSLLIKACTGSRGFHVGRLIHCFVIKDGFNCDCDVGHRLADLYSEFGIIEDAEKVFDDVSIRETMPESENFRKESTFILVTPLNPLAVDSKALSSIIHKCKNLCQVKQAHAYWVTSIGMLLRPQIANKLLLKYIFFDDGHYARNVFDEMPQRDLVSWNLMIHWFARDSDLFRCFKTFRKLIESGVRPNHSTLSLIIKACYCNGSTGYQMGRLIHCFVIKEGLDCDPVVFRRLVDMYTEFGLIADANKLCDDKVPFKSYFGLLALSFVTFSLPLFGVGIFLAYR